MLEAQPTHTPALRASVPPPRLGWGTRILNKLIRWGYLLRGKHRYDEFLLERIGDVRLLVTPGVFNPKLLRTGEFFASQLDSRVIQPTTAVLDMGTGSGASAMFAARRARRVVAVDINPAAVRCARINVLMNHLEHKVEVRQGDLFAAVAGEKFDLILFNPPFLRGTPRNDRDRAWRSEDVPERFAAGLREHLNPGGCALVLLSSFGDASMFLRQFEHHGFGVSRFAQRRFVGETVVIFRLGPA
jgi:release factor glutamine methyltransferase